MYMGGGLLAVILIILLLIWLLSNADGYDCAIRERWRVSRFCRYSRRHA
jgi:hypothetical protein